MIKGQVISIANHKGGIGKTTTAINLGAALSRKKRSEDEYFRVLIIDMDPQSNATMTIFDHEKYDYLACMNMLDVFNGRSILDIIKKSTIKNVDIAPAHVNMFENGDKISSSPQGLLGLKSEIDRAKLKSKYDFIIIDTPPNVGTFKMNSIAASDYYILAIMSESKYSIDGLHVIEKLISDIKSIVTRNLRPLGYLLTMYDGRNTTCKAQEEVVREKYGNLVFDSVIRRNTDIEKATSNGTSIFKENHRANGAKDYASLADEVIKRINE